MRDGLAEEVGAGMPGSGAIWVEPFHPALPGALMASNSDSEPVGSVPGRA